MEKEGNNGSYVEWSAIIGGAVLASALSLVMVQFGSVVGVADLDSIRHAPDGIIITPERVLMASIYILITQVLASMIGGYLAGRMRAPFSSASEHEKEIRDGFHGVLTWATASLAVAVSVALVTAFAHLTVDKTAAVERAQDVMAREHRMAVILAFGAAATSLVSGVAAWASAVKGGDHRDRGIDYGRYITFLVRR